MAKANDNKDVLERMEEGFNPEKEMSSAPEEKSAEVSPAKEEKPRVTRREVMRTMAQSREDREQKLAEEQSDLTKESALRSAIDQKTTLYGKAAGVEVIKGSNGASEVAVAVLLSTNIKILIPFSELYTYNPIDMSTVDLSTEDGQKAYLFRKRAFADKIIGSVLCFNIRAIFPEGNVVTGVGSRKSAMRRIAKSAFGGSKPKFKVGDVSEASVTAVSRHAICVEFNGVDVVIPQYKLTLRWMMSTRDNYHIGDKIKVKIREIVLDDNGNVERLVLDPIACELAESRDRYSLLKDGTRVKGTVTNVYRPIGTKGIFIYAWLDDWQIPARILRIDANDFGREIVPGTSLRLEVHSHDESGHVACIALSEHGNSSMFTGTRR